MAADRKYQNEARVYVAGNEIRDIYECSYTIPTEMARSGLPTGNARPHRLKIVRRSETETPGFEWAFNSQPKNFQSGKIEFYNTKGEIMKTFEWDKGYGAHYREGVPDLTESERATMLEEYEICAEEFRCGEGEVHCHW